MKVRILQDGTYSKFNIPGYRHRVGKQQLAAGDVVDYPDWYAEEIIASGLAVVYAEPPDLSAGAHLQGCLPVQTRQTGGQACLPEHRQAQAEAIATQLINATSAAFRLAGELDVDLEILTGSGKGGRITAGDVRKAAQ